MAPRGALAALGLLASAAGHGALISPRSRNSVDYLVGQNDPDPDVNRTDPATGRVVWCVNASGFESCENGQAAFWYSQGCFIGCPACDHRSGRAQTDLCGLGFNATLDAARLRTVNRAAAAGSAADIYRHNPWRAPGAAPVADACGLAGGTPWGADAPE